MNKIKSFLYNNYILIIFGIFALVIIGFGTLFTIGFNINPEKIEKIIKKFSTEDYTLPYYIAERYMIWRYMRIFFWWLALSLPFLSIISSLVVVFFAAKKDEERKQNHIVFLSLLSICFTIACLIINPEKRASASQHAWRGLDSCIIQTINDNSTTIEEKNKILVEALIEFEKYMELKDN